MNSFLHKKNFPQVKKTKNKVVFILIHFAFPNLNLIAKDLLPFFL